MLADAHYTPYKPTGGGQADRAPRTGVRGSLGRPLSTHLSARYLLYRRIAGAAGQGRARRPPLPRPKTYYGPYLAVTHSPQTLDAQLKPRRPHRLLRPCICPSYLRRYRYVMGRRHPRIQMCGDNEQNEHKLRRTGFRWRVRCLQTTYFLRFAPLTARLDSPICALVSRHNHAKAR